MSTNSTTDSSGGRSERSACRRRPSRTPCRTSSSSCIAASRSSRGGAASGRGSSVSRAGSSRTPIGAAAVSVDALPDAPSPPRTGRVAQKGAAQPRGADPAPSSSSSNDLLGEEIALIRTAQGELRAGTPEDALATLSRHASRFPHGVLRDERMTLQALALCERGDVAAARALRRELARTSPGSSHLQRLSSSCAAR